jgi:hypothetical protein
MKQLLLTATVLLVTNAYIIFRLIDPPNMQVSTYNNYIFVSNCYKMFAENESKELKQLNEPSPLVPVIVPKCEFTKDTSTTLQIEDNGDSLLYNATAWLQDKNVFFKFFSIYSYDS